MIPLYNTFLLVRPLRPELVRGLERTEVGKHMKAMMGALQAARCFAAKCER